MSKKEIKRLVILNIPYLILGLLATNLGEAWRLAEGTDYEVVYIAPLPIHTNRPAFLESVFEKFNLDRPDDFKGHSLSVSDIVAIRENGAVSCYYCDSTCFQELPGLIPENYLKNAEMQLEDDYGMIDGVVNNGAKDCKEKAAKDKAEKPSVVEQLKNQPHCEVRKKSTVKYTEQER